MNYSKECTNDKYWVAKIKCLIMDVPMEAKDVQVLREQPLVLRWDVMPFGILHFVVIVGGIYAVFVEHLNWHLFLLMFASLVSLHVVALLSSTWSVRAHAFFRFFKVSLIPPFEQSTMQIKSVICSFIYFMFEKKEKFLIVSYFFIFLFYFSPFN